jgi:hypothetical protein
VKTLALLLSLLLAFPAVAAPCTQSEKLVAGAKASCDGDLMPTDKLLKLLKIQDDYDKETKDFDRVKALWEKEREIILADLAAERAAREKLLSIPIPLPVRCPEPEGPSFFEHPIVVAVLVGAAASTVTYFVVR